MGKPDLWFCDCEAYAYDVIWVFKNKRTGERTVFHNDTEGVRSFVDANPDLWIVGYNFRDYDQYILKAMLLGWSVEQVKELSDTLIFDELQDAWDLLGQEAWDVELPPIIDLFHDIVPRKGLKEIEANIGLNVKETSVSFDIDRPLTPEELDDCIKYCIHDVDATEALYYLRTDYISTKKSLCDMAGLSDADMMKNTNARVVSEALHAVHCDPLNLFGEERYIDVCPTDIIDLSRMPGCVLDFVDSVTTYSGWRDEIDPVLFDLHGCPTVMGIGGIHASTGVIDEHVFKSGPRKGKTENRYRAVPRRYESGNGRTLLIQDIGSFYPSMMIIFDYLSRGVPFEWRSLFNEFYDLRMEAKGRIKECEKRGDKKGAIHWKKQADAAKLVLNTVYGCMKNRWNKLYDPFMATCVCLTGQLLIVDLMNRIHEAVSDVEIVQLNTDGWVLNVADECIGDLEAVIGAWTEETGFTVDTDIIKQMVQRDVNNYVMEFDTGKVKAKGGTVKNWNGGDFKSNSATIIDEALVRNMLYGTPLEDTIGACGDLERFQLVLKAGGTYKDVVKVYGMRDRFKTEGDGKVGFQNEPIVSPVPGKVQRVYAVQYDGAAFYKRKENGSLSKFPDSPECAMNDYDLPLHDKFQFKSYEPIEMIDKRWYIELAEKKLKQFTEGKD